MLHALRMSFAGLGVVGLGLCGLEPAHASCQLVTATASAPSKAEAARQEIRDQEDDRPAVRWIEVKGKVTRPAAGGALNTPEAEALVA